MDWQLVIMGVAFAGGYVASIYTWPTIRTHIAGADAEIDRLRDRINKIMTAMRG
jgi:hypothetical protein